MSSNLQAVFDALMAFREARDKAVGRGKKIIYELEQNHILIANWEKSRVGTAKVIQRLPINTFEKMQHKFRASDIKMKKITKRSVGKNNWDAHYIGWSSEKLVRHIYKKIRELKEIQLTSPTDPKFRKSVRLININRLLRLLSKHLPS